MEEEEEVMDEEGVTDDDLEARILSGRTTTVNLYDVSPITNKQHKGCAQEIY